MPSFVTRLTSTRFLPVQMSKDENLVCRQQRMCRFTMPMISELSASNSISSSLPLQWRRSVTSYIQASPAFCPCSVLSSSLRFALLGCSSSRNFTSRQSASGDERESQPCVTSSHRPFLKGTVLPESQQWLDGSSSPRLVSWAYATSTCVRPSFNHSSMISHRMKLYRSIRLFLGSLNLHIHRIIGGSSTADLLSLMAAQTSNGPGSQCRSPKRRSPYVRFALPDQQRKIPALCAENTGKRRLPLRQSHSGPSIATLTKPLKDCLNVLHTWCSYFLQQIMLALCNGLSLVSCARGVYCHARDLASALLSVFMIAYKWSKWPLQRGLPTALDDDHQADMPTPGCAMDSPLKRRSEHSIVRGSPPVDDLGDIDSCQSSLKLEPLTAPSMEGPALFEAVMAPADKAMTVEVIFDTKSSTWELSHGPLDDRSTYRLSCLRAREKQRALVLCSTELLTVLASNTNPIVIYDQQGQSSRQSIEVHHLSQDIGVPKISSGVLSRLCLSSQDTFKIKNLKEFLLYANDNIDNASTQCASLYMKTWIVTLSQLSDIVDDRCIYGACRTAFFQLHKRGFAQTVYLQLLDGDFDIASRPTNDVQIMLPGSWTSRYGDSVSPSMRDKTSKAFSFFCVDRRLASRPQLYVIQSGQPACLDGTYESGVQLDGKRHQGCTFNMPKSLFRMQQKDGHSDSPGQRRCEKGLPNTCQALVPPITPESRVPSHISLQNDTMFVGKPLPYPQPQMKEFSPATRTAVLRQLSLAFNEQWLKSENADYHGDSLAHNQAAMEFSRRDDSSDSGCADTGDEVEPARRSPPAGIDRRDASEQRSARKVMAASEVSEQR